MPNGQFPAVISLSALNGENGFALNGEAVGDYSGYSISGAGDINGDQWPDIIIGAYGYNTFTGRSYVVFGGPGVGSGGLISLSSLNGSNGFKLNGESTSSRSGYSVAGIGDVNGDQHPDLLIGAYQYPAANYKGRSYVVFGGSGVGGSGTIALSSLNGVTGFKLDGEFNNDESGYSVSAAGDINRDGYADLLIGAWGYSNGGKQGRSYVMFGKPGVGGSGTIALSSLTGVTGFKLNGESNKDESGYSVSAAGDVNNDGYPDLLIGASGYPSGSNQGRSYVVFGGPGVGSSGLISLANLNGSNGFKLDGEFNNDNSGYSVSAAGDINADGYLDLLIGAYGYQSGSNRGRSYVVFGGPGVGSSGQISLSNLNGSNGFKLDGESNHDNSGIRVGAAGDINGDGYADLLIGATNYTGNGIGRSYVVFGGPGVGKSETIALSSLNGVTGFVLDGENAGDNSGVSVRPAGDFNGDGVDDFLIGAEGFNQSTGRSYVIFGDAPPVMVNNNLKINQGDSVVFSDDNLLVTDANHPDDQISLTITNGQYGHFAWLTSGCGGAPITQFSQQNISAGQVMFCHDGSVEAPVYSVGVTTPGLAFIFPQPAFIDFDTIPLLLNNNLKIGQGQTVIITSGNLSATQPDGNDPALTFVITQLEHGNFSYAADLDEPIFSIVQQEIMDGIVRFTQDDSPQPPSYYVYVSDGRTASPTQPAAVIFDPKPILINNNLHLYQGECLSLTSSNLYAIHQGSVEPNLNFIINDIQHGSFTNQLFANNASFIQQAVTDGEVVFCHDNSIDAPSYDVVVSDGEVMTAPNATIVTFAVNPVIVNNNLLISAGSQQVLTAEQLLAMQNGIISEDLIFNVADLEQGYFENINKPSIQIFSFSQGNVLANQIVFVQKSNVTAPDYQVQVTDADEFAHSNFSDSTTFLVTRNDFLINQNESYLLTPEVLNITSNSDFSDINWIVNAVSYGQFELQSQPGKMILSFTQSQVAEEEIIFRPNGSANAPSFLLEVNAAGENYGAVNGFVDFATPPKLEHAFIKINPPDRIKLTTDNFLADDSHVGVEELVFHVSQVENDHFGFSQDWNTPINSFTQQDINDGTVFFVATTNQPPSFMVSVDNGRMNCSGCPVAGEVIAPTSDSGSDSTTLIAVVVSIIGFISTIPGLIPLLTYLYNKLYERCLTRKIEGLDSEIGAAIYEKLMIGIITTAKHQAYSDAAGEIIREIDFRRNRGEELLRARWGIFPDRQKRNIKSAIANSTVQIFLNNNNYDSCCNQFVRFFKNICKLEVKPEEIKEGASKIADCKAVQEAVQRDLKEEDCPGQYYSLNSRQ